MALEAAIMSPQWSPSLADGTTPEHRPQLVQLHWAAMEPVLGGRDDPAHGRRTAARRPGRNGARPWRTGRRAPIIYLPKWSGRAAMEPVLGGRDDTSETSAPTAG